MNSRRRFLKNSISLSTGVLMSGKPLGATPQSGLIMSDEGEPHERTWMAFVANRYIWSKHQIPEVKRNLILLAQTIAQYEPVSMLVSSNDFKEAGRLLGKPAPGQHPVELVKFAVDDLWLRDTGPTFVKNTQGEKIAIDFNFNGWGNKQEHGLDKQVAKFIARRSGAILKTTPLVLVGRAESSVMLRATMRARVKTHFAGNGCSLGKKCNAGSCSHSDSRRANSQTLCTALRPLERACHSLRDAPCSQCLGVG